MSNVLVTGGAGFIGSHLVERLVSIGHDVTVLDNLSTGDLSNLEAVQSAITLIRGDLLDPAVVREAVAGKEFICHTAANASVNLSIEDPVMSCNRNVVATIGLLKASSDAGVRRLVFSSSTSVYGYAENLPVTEAHPLQPASPYALDKVCCEAYCRLWSKLYGLDTVCLRYFSVYGPRQNPIGVHPGGVTIVINQLRNEGESQVLAEGQQTRDMIYVGDVVQANICAMDMPGELNGKAYNICTGTSIVVADMHRKTAELMGVPARIAGIPMPEGNVIDSSGDPGPAQTGLGFEAETSLEQGLQQTIDWSNERA
ncbi:MAG: NAD-dependent epimerase/dehydratase family protein [Lentisphaerae bacterium]|nr:NAD-dependent epimerase/dehydratase family protein [Lentisphaerota bacterium]